MRELRSGFAIAQRQALTKEAKAERLAPQLTQEQVRVHERQAQRLPELEGVKPPKFDRRETEIFRKRTNKADFVAASRVASMSSMGLFAPIGEVDMKSAPGPVRASRTDRRSDRSRP